MTDEELKAELERVKAENERLKANAVPTRSSRSARRAACRFTAWSSHEPDEFSAWHLRRPRCAEPGQDLARAERCCCAILSLFLRVALLARGLLPPNKTCPLSGTTNKCHPQDLFVFSSPHQP